MVNRLGRGSLVKLIFNFSYPRSEGVCCRAKLNDFVISQDYTLDSSSNKAWEDRAKTPYDCYSDPPTVITGTGADRTVLSATLPSRIRSVPLRPVVPITTTSISFAST